MTLLQDTSPDEIEAMYRNADNEDERAEARLALKRINSGRFEDLLNNAHRSVAHADSASRKALEKIHGEEFLTWIGVFGLIEGLDTFEDLTGVEPR